MIISLMNIILCILEVYANNLNLILQKTFLLEGINRLMLFQNLQFLMLFVAFFALVYTIYSQGDVSSCFYTQRFDFFSTTTSQPAGTYSIIMTWSSIQNFVNYAIALTGFKVAIPSTLLRQDVWLSNVTTTGTQVDLKIDAGSQISSISFQVILIKTCSGTITLQNNLFYPSLLYSASRSSNAQTTNVYVGYTFGADTSLYLSQVFFTSWAFTSTLNGIEQVQVKTYPVVTGQNYQTIEFNSDFQILNRIFRIRYCYLLIDLSTFTDLAYYNSNFVTGSFFPSISYDNIGIPSVFNPYLSNKCIIGLRFIWTMNIANNPTQISLIDTGTANMSNFSTLIGSNMNGLGISILCIQVCPSTTYVNYPVSPSTCFQYIPNCLSLVSNISCAQCIANYFLYRDHTQCSLTCPFTQYGNTTTYTCESCTRQCLICYNDSSCQRCRSGSFVKGGCTNVVGCIEISSYLNYQCILCQPKLFFEVFNGTCVCQSGYRLVTQLCTNVTGCKVVKRENNSTSCAFCDIYSNLIISNGSCICITGFYFNSSNSCIQICGDGLLMTLPCDDGNNEDGDGCSSTCSVQKFYKCVNGSSSSPSQCFYVKKDISLSVSRIDRANLDNTGVFTFKLSPANINYRQINLVQSGNFQCSQSNTLVGISLEGNQLTVIVTFHEDLQVNEAVFSISLNTSYFSQTNVSLDFQMISDGAKLILLKDISKLNLIEEGIKILVYIIFGVFFLSFFVHKMIGIQMINSFQVVYLLHLINPSYTAPYSLLKLLFPIVFNFFYYTNNLSNIYSQKQHIIFSINNEEFTLLLINCISFGFMFAFIALRVIIIISQENNQSLQPKSNGKQLSCLQTASKIIYKYIVFPFLIGTLTVSMLLLKRQRQLTESSKSISLMCFSQISLTSLVFFYQLKTLFINCSGNRGFVGLSRCQHRYISIYITFLLIVTVILKFAYQFGDNFNTEFLLSIVYLAFLIFIIAYGPYQAFVHNIGLVAYLLVVIYFLIWSSLKRLNIISQAEQQQIILLSFLLILMALSLLTTILRIIHQCRLKWHKIFDKKQIKQKAISNEKKEHKACNNPNCKSLLQDQQIFIANISKGTTHRYNEIETSLFVPINRKASSISAQQSMKKIMRAKFRKRFKGMQQQELRDELF